MGSGGARLDAPGRRRPIAGSRLRGLSREVLEPGHPAFDTARRVWNGAIDRQPMAVVRCRTTGEVARTVGFARDAGLPLAVRGGGHGMPGFGTCDGGIVLDLSPMRRVAIDAGRRVALVAGGARWREFDGAAHAHGLASTGGMISSTGVGGLTLGGGIGWLARRCGLACDSLLVATLVTADGEVRRVDDASEPELLWGLRGGGGNFGVVTEFEFQLQPVSTVVAGMVVFPAVRLAEVTRFYGAYVRNTPDELTTMLVVQSAPDEASIPARLRGELVVVVAACHAGDPVRARQALEPILALRPSAGGFEEQPYPTWQQVFDEEMRPGRRTYIKGGFTGGLADGMIDAIASWMSVRPSSASEIDLHQMGGAIARVGDDESAFADRHSPFLFNILTRWDDPDEDDAHRSWARGFAADLEQFGTGRAYVNFVTDVEDVAALRSRYGEQRFRRLKALKRRYDPANLFHLNQNIVP